jgi:hypothetical protein
MNVETARLNLIHSSRAYWDRDSFAGRLNMVPSSIRCDDYRATQIGDDYRGAHADGYDYADHMECRYTWAKMVWDVAGTPLEGYLFLAAARDYAEHAGYCEGRGEQPLPRGKWCEAHVAGQIDRALEIADEI